VARLADVDDSMNLPTKGERISHNARLWRFDRHHDEQHQRIDASIPVSLL
jgi:hypothetical protein